MTNIRFESEDARRIAQLVADNAHLRAELERCEQVAEACRHEARRKTTQLKTVALTVERLEASVETLRETVVRQALRITELEREGSK
ncbi:hypothetical protein ACFV1L_10330 [Kitasatospora sp. NPDC059646]|uniref:hypothetical protein n=1 Tax=Kitasatospora sp. NPDC059646 TaxID=3346893 RepID=UPI003677F69C